MNTEAFVQLVRVLEYVEDRELPFDLTHWAQPLYKKREIAEKHLLFFTRVRIESRKCGTAACAVGYAAADPWFVEHGLRLTQPRDNPELAGLAYESYRNWKACAAFFGVTTAEAKFLFNPESYPGIRATPTDVIIRIRSFTASKRSQRAAAVIS